MKATKYGAKRTKTSDGLQADSGLEAQCYDLLRQANIEFEYQYPIVVTPPLVRQDWYSTLIKKAGIAPRLVKKRKTGKLAQKHIVSPKNNLPVKAIIDFVIFAVDIVILLDTKGMATPDWKIKIKQIEFNFSAEGKKCVVMTPSSKADILNCIEWIKQIQKME